MINKTEVHNIVLLCISLFRLLKCLDLVGNKQAKRNEKIKDSFFLLSFRESVCASTPYYIKHIQRFFSLFKCSVLLVFVAGACDIQHLYLSGNVFIFQKYTFDDALINARADLNVNFNSFYSHGERKKINCRKNNKTNLKLNEAYFLFISIFFSV